jgi:hypothetical protein
LALEHCRSTGAAPSTFVFLCTPGWIEAAYFKNKIVSSWTCFSREEKNISALIRQFRTDTGDHGEGASLFIIAGDSSAEDKELTAGFQNTFSIKAAELPIKKRLHKLRIFTNRPLAKKRRKVLWKIGAVFCLALCLSLRIGTAKAEGRLQAAKAVYRNVAAQKEKKKTKANTNTMPPMYTLLAHIQASLRGGFISALTIKQESFTLEGESSSALETLEALEKGLCFRDLVLHQALGSKIGEKFTISGRITNGKSQKI